MLARCPGPWAAEVWASQATQILGEDALDQNGFVSMPESEAKIDFKSGYALHSCLLFRRFSEDLVPRRKKSSFLPPWNQLWTNCPSPLNNVHGQGMPKIQNEYSKKRVCKKI